MSILVQNATIVTMDTKNSIYHQAAVAISGNKISKIYQEPYPQEKCDTIIDAKGQVLLPGFINVHTHGLGVLLRGRSAAFWGNPVRHADIAHFTGPFTADTALLFAQLFLCELLRSGCTTFVDSSDYGDSMAQAVDDGGLRAMIAGTNIKEDNPAMGQEKLQQSKDFIRKWQAKNDRMQPMLHAEAASSCSPALWQELAQLAKDKNIFITTHLAQSTEELALMKEKYGQNCVSYLADCGVINGHFLGVDGIHLTEEDLDLLADRAASLAFNPAANALHGQMPPIAPALSKGIASGLGTDSLSGDMFKALRHALTSWRMREHTADAPQPEEVFPLANSLAAKALGKEKEIGSIEEGKLADCILVDFQAPNLLPLYPDKYQAQLTHFGMASNVQTVIIDGKIIMRNRIIQTIDEKAVMQEAQKLYAAQKGGFSHE